MQETYTTLDENTILVTTSTPVVDNSGNPVVDGDGNPVNSTTNVVMTLDQVNQDLINHQNMQQADTDFLVRIQNEISKYNDAIVLDNARLVAFSQPTSPTPAFQLQKPVVPLVKL